MNAISTGTASTESHEERWDNIIGPSGSLIKLNLWEVWRYRDLLWLLVRRDVVAFYKQTIFGPLWYFIQPLFTMVMYIFVFGNLAKLSTDGIPQALFYLTGIASWGYFSECLNKTATVFVDNAHVFGKVYYPRLTVPFSLVISNLVRFGMNLALLLGFMIFYALQGVPINITWHLILFPVIVVLMAAQGLGLGMLVSSLTTKYRDLSILLPFGVQLLMYATTVVYPLSSLKGSRMFNVVAYNPLTPLMEGMRKSLLGQGTFDMYSLGYAIMVTLLLLVLGTVIFNKVEKDFIDTI